MEYEEKEDEEQEKNQAKKDANYSYFSNHNHCCSTYFS